MVSLTAVEGYVSHLWPEHAHAVVSLPDPKKGEQLVLVTDQADARREALVAFARQQGIAEFSIPKTILKVEELPLLGSGKVDYVRLKALAEEATRATPAAAAAGWDPPEADDEAAEEDG